ncbi:SDR family NAD(P)-dependent oxidoreductase [Actinomadura mexicana]|uniref:3-oxoacyl-[acyl-carrier-protein] reductase n=1 Tax=Actinomadura mexicana TaxID=134959 RepID=A0A238XA91_9ACTN|nr:3-oxoacyl-ACP reductase family protein [Actinomadura mexicana]SNR55955.1 3-oxoacyl-[acyl-carrier-protein] reductase [Actinomadura mexicana]
MTTVRERPLDGKVAIVTGAGRGLGRSMAGALADAGARVCVAARSGDELDTFVREQADLGREALACPTDVTDAEAVNRLVDGTVDAFGRLDVLVNNSGIVATTPLLDQEPDEWDRIIATNLRGVYLATRAAGRYMVPAKSGKVVNIASNHAMIGVPGFAAYAASKAGVIAFTKTMAIEWARYGISVNALAPGYFATPLNAGLRADPELTRRVHRAIPAHRFGRPEELAPWLLLLAGDASDFMTGETIVIDGGQIAR